MTSHQLSSDPQRIWAMSSIGPRMALLDSISHKMRRLEMSKTTVSSSCVFVIRRASHSDPSNTQKYHPGLDFLFHSARMSRCHPFDLSLAMWMDCRCTKRFHVALLWTRNIMRKVTTRKVKRKKTKTLRLTKRRLSGRTEKVRESQLNI